jgi:hypothetical protein
MAIESFVACDNPACTNAVNEANGEVSHWWLAMFHRRDYDAEAHDDTFPEVDACSAECIGPAILDRLRSEGE